MRVDPSGNKWSWGKFWTVVGIVAIAAVAIALTIATAGAAAAGAGFLAGWAVVSLGITSTAVFAAATAIATVATIALAVVAVAGIATFALAESISVYTGYNFMSWMGSAYEPVKMALNMVPMLFGMLSQYAPESYYEEKAMAKERKIAYKNVDKYKYGNSALESRYNKFGDDTRPYYDSTFTQKNIIKIGTMTPGTNNSYYYKAYGSFGSTYGFYEIKISNLARMIYHFQFTGV